jgi:hypothetical protein
MSIGHREGEGPKATTDVGVITRPNPDATLGQKGGVQTTSTQLTIQDFYGYWVDEWGNERDINASSVWGTVEWVPATNPLAISKDKYPTGIRHNAPGDFKAVWFMSTDRQSFYTAATSDNGASIVPANEYAGNPKNANIFLKKI